MVMGFFLERGPDESKGQEMSSAQPSFTDTQGQYLAFIDAYKRVHGRPPAETDMQRHFRVSPPSVHQMVLTLERAGFIRRQPGLARSIEVLVSPERLPVLRPPQGVKSSVQKN
jgi:DNA-binding MarR family transcriptional regulator